MLYEVIDATVIEPAECPIRRELALLAANLDTRFLRVGTTLAEAIAMIDRIIGGLDTIVDALDADRVAEALRHMRRQNATLAQQLPPAG